MLLIVLHLRQLCHILCVIFDFVPGPIYIEL
jgi:hypothetical protein